MRLSEFRHEAARSERAFLNTWAGAAFLVSEGASDPEVHPLQAAGDQRPPLIGSGPTCLVRVQGEGIGLAHARLVPPRNPGESWLLLDQGQPGGTHLDGKRVTVRGRRPLRDGAELLIAGSARFRFYYPATFVRERLRPPSSKRAPAGTIARTGPAAPIGVASSSAAGRVPSTYDAAVGAQLAAPAAGDAGSMTIVPDGCLYLTSPLMEPVRLRLDAPVVLGRSPRADVQLPDAKVSRRHAEVVARDDAVFVRDLGSSNGTFLDEVRLDGTPCRFEPGQRLRIGKTILELRPEEALPPAEQRLLAMGHKLTGGRALTGWLRGFLAERRTCILEVAAKGLRGCVVLREGEIVQTTTDSGLVGADALARLLDADVRAFSVHEPGDETPLSAELRALFDRGCAARTRPTQPLRRVA